MRSPGHFHRLTIGLTCLALITPRPCVAEELPRGPSRQIFQATDIKLTAHGHFDGQIVDSQGNSAPATEVQLWNNGQLVARCVADQEGHFEFRGLRAGVYQLLAPSTGRVVRLWQPAAAPPAAQSALLLVQGPVVRGQYPPHGRGPHGGAYDGAVMKTLSNPWLFSGLLAAGIAIPIALSNDDDDRDGS